MTFADEMYALAKKSDDVKTAQKYTINKYDKVRQYIKKEALRGQMSGGLVDIAGALGGSPFHTQSLIQLLTDDGFIVVDSTGNGTHAVFWPGAEATEAHRAKLEELSSAPDPVDEKTQPGPGEPDGRADRSAGYGKG